MKTTRDSAWTMSVPKAGRKYFNLGINCSYRAARTGEMPTVRIGRRVLACVPAIERMLGAQKEVQEEAHEELTSPRRPKAGGRPRIVETEGHARSVPPEFPIQVRVGERLVTLTASERADARRFGVSEIKYAKRKLMLIEAGRESDQRQEPLGMAEGDNEHDEKIWPGR